MALNYVPVPQNFTDLFNASKIPPSSKPLSVIGVCVESLDPIRCTGGKQDYKFTFTLHDPTWFNGVGMEFVFFNKDFGQLPIIKDQGDVVILRNVKTMVHKGLVKGISNSASSWVVLPFTEVANIETVEDLTSKARWQRKGQSSHNQYPAGAQAALPNGLELKYAKAIAEQENPDLWPQMQPRAQANIADAAVSNGGNQPPHREKFKTLQNLELPVGNGYIFVDLLGEVRRIFSNDFLTELYITDYTTNEKLYDYKSSDNQAGRTGDPYGYIKEESSTWPGPWGQMTMTVVCRDGQSHLANAKVKLGDFVLLRNIQVKMDKTGWKLEGNCRDDPKYPEKELIEVVKSSDERKTEVIRRKRAYEEKMKADGTKFYRDPSQVPKKRPREETTEERTDEPKAKRSKNRNKKNRKAQKEAEQQTNKVTSAPVKHEQALTANPSIRIHNHEGLSYKNIVDILDPEILYRTTAKGHPYRLPFQNCTYKSKVRVVDFFPENIADFAAPRRVSQYDELSDHGSSDDESDVDLTQERDGYEIKWEWRFFLLVEDAKLPPGAHGGPTQMELLVADADGDCLFNMEACNLRDQSNENVLSRLREKLFHLWGDLQEKKDETKGADEALVVKPSARPFECLIKEYGVPVRNPIERSDDVVAYDRLFRLFGTTI
ncbi:hypothetical protein H2200_012679 [Cladophialophora chaetospira]|uniref:Protection of telomeres protein 1 n=1 Tax=Cladophialophora chaetospira TaxID=386627 RepID=A0AA39CC63_9EURO|nr:hypothetical protein H2200_012679 [Cladophialophora chaetospira]